MNIKKDIVKRLFGYNIDTEEISTDDLTNFYGMTLFRQPYGAGKEYKPKLISLSPAHLASISAIGHIGPGAGHIRPIVEIGLDMLFMAIGNPNIDLDDLATKLVVLCKAGAIKVGTGTLGENLRRFANRIDPPQL